MHTIKPIDADALTHAAQETGAIVVAEEHMHSGGLGAAVSQSLAATTPCPVEFVDLGDRYAESGKPDDLMKKYGMLAANIIAAADKVLKRK
jgi:transketolase